MKKTVGIVALTITALAVLTTGVAVAQSPQPAGTGYGMGRGNGEGPLHEYMVTALAQALGIPAADFETRRDAGKTAYQIALDLGISADKIPALLSTARGNALDAAVTANAITQQQADWMKSRQAGMGSGVCDGTGQPGGGMGRGGRWGNTTP